MPPTHLATISPAIDSAPPTAPASSWELARLAIQRASVDDGKTVLVLAFTAPAGDPLAWLSQHHGIPAVYWRSRDGWEYAGIGATHVIGGRGAAAMNDAADTAAAFVRDRIVSEPAPLARRPRFFGGFAFDPNQASAGEWHNAGFGDALLILPEAVYARRADQSYVFFSIEVTARSSAESLVERLALLNHHYWGGFEAGDMPLPTGPDWTPIDSETDYANWLNRSQAVVGKIEAGQFEKVVLARRQALRIRHASGPLDPWPTLAHLRAFDSACTPFGFQLSDDYAFIGASPERLFRLANGRLESEAIAGTIARGASDAEDQVLARQLMDSAKDQLEHRLVVEAVADGLRRLGAGDAGGTSSQVDLVRLRTLQHLRSTMSTELRPGASVGEILETLHPTPAVAGVPRAEACAIIREQEPHARGWYGGPVGWIGADAAEFAVGIRSALLGPDTAWLYAGAGLVRGSVPEDEWREIQDKLQAFRSAVNPSHGPS